MSTGQGHVHRRLGKCPQETAQLSQQERSARRNTSVQQQNQETAAETCRRTKCCQGMSVTTSSIPVQPVIVPVGLGHLLRCFQ